MKEKSPTLQTLLVHGPGSPDPDLCPPLHMTSAFRFDSADHGAAIFADIDMALEYTEKCVHPAG